MFNAFLTIRLWWSCVAGSKKKKKMRKTKLIAVLPRFDCAINVVPGNFDAASLLYFFASPPSTYTCFQP